MKVLEAVEKIEKMRAETLRLNEKLEKLQICIDTKYYKVGFFVENDIPKIYIMNNSGYKVNFYHSHFGSFIHNLQLLDKMIEEKELNDKSLHRILNDAMGEINGK